MDRVGGRDEGASGRDDRRRHFPLILLLVTSYFSFSFDFLTRRDREVVDFTRSHVKNNSELTNLMKMYRIEGYNGK